MPVSSIEGIFSNSMYFISMLLLLIVLLNPVVGLYHSASLDAAKKLAQGVASEVDDLSPGMVTSVDLGSYPGTQESISLSGSAVTATVNDVSFTAPLGWPAANSTLVPGRLYDLYLAGGVAQVD